jgi:hypothetical protein
MALRVIGNPTLFGGVDFAFESQRARNFGYGFLNYFISINPSYIFVIFYFRFLFFYVILVILLFPVLFSPFTVLFSRKKNRKKREKRTGKITGK